jgi:hypothetical protein
LYEHIRAGYQAALAAREQELAAAQQALGAARATVTAATANLSAANAALSSARSAVPPAQAALNAARADADQKAQAASRAQAAVTSWEAQEPEPYIGGEPMGLRSRTTSMLPGGGLPRRPNPAHVTWARQYAVLKAARDAANTALAAARTAVGPAQANLATANQHLTAAQATATTRAQELSAANTALARAQGSATSAAAAIDSARGQIAELDARVARLLAEPLDRAGLTTMADQEQAEVARLRRVRAQARHDRYAAATSRAALLTDHDGSVAAIAPLAAALRGWADAAYPDPPQVAAALEALAANAASQATATTRADDLAALTAQVRAALERLQRTVDAAGHDRDAKYQTLQAARESVAKVVAEQP